MTVEELQVIVTARTRGLEQQMQGLTRQLQGVQRQTNTMSTNMTRTFTNLKRTLIGLGVGKAIKSMFNLSRTYEAATQQVNRIFRENASAIEAWIEKNAKTFGMARADAMEYASIYGNLVKGFEKDTAKMSQYTTKLLEATTVIASNTGRTVKDVSERIRSGILGNTEAIEDLGIYAQVAMIKTSNAFKTIANGRTWDALTFQEQQQIRVMSILEQSAAQFGTSIQNNTNYQLMMLTASLKNVALNLSNAFMPIVNAVLPSLNAMALALANVTNKIAAFMNALFGTNFNTGAGQVQQVATGASDAASGYEDMANAADDAGESAKKAGQKAKNAIMGFDEINQLTKDSGNSDSGSSSSGTTASDAGVATSTAMSEAAEDFSIKIEGVISRLKDLFKEGFEIGLGDGWQAQVDDINNSIEDIKTNLKDIFTDSEVNNAFSKWVDVWIIASGKVTGAAVSMGTTVAQNLLGGFNNYLDQNKEYIQKRIVGILNVSTEISNLAGEFSIAFADIFSVLGGDTAQQITTNIIAIFFNGFLGAVEVALKLGRDVISAFTIPITENKELIKSTLEKTLKPIESITGSIKDFVTNTFISINESYDTYVAPAFQNIANALTNLMNNLLNNYNAYILPVIDGIASKVGDLFTTYIQPNIDLIIASIGRVIDAGSKILDEVIEPMIEDLNGLLAPTLGFVIEKISDFAIKLTGELFEALGKIADKIADVCEWLAEHKLATEIIITTLGALATAIGIVTVAMNLGAIAQGLITTATTLWNVAAGIGATVTGAFGAAMAILTSPITLVVLAITAVIAAVVLLIRHWDDVKKIAAKCWDSIKGTWNKVGEWFDTTVVQPVAKFFTDLWNGIKQSASNAWTNVCNAWQSASQWFSTTIIEPIKTKFTEWKTSISTLATQAWTGVKTAWSGAKQWFDTTIVTPITTAFSKLWNGLMSGASNAFSSVGNSAKNGMNWVIDHINNMINKINSKLSFNLPEFFGGGKVGFSIPNVPRLARGGIVDGATFMGNYIAGEAGKEMIVPLENTSFVDKLASSLGNAVMAAMQFNNTNNDSQTPIELILEIDGREFARATIPGLQKEIRRTGVKLV